MCRRLQERIEERETQMGEDSEQRERKIAENLEKCRVQTKKRSAQVE